MSNVVKESSDTSDDLSDAPLEPESSAVSLANGIPASTVDGTEDVSLLQLSQMCLACVLRMMTLPVIL